MKTKVELAELIAYAFNETGLAELGQKDNEIADYDGNFKRKMKSEL